LTTIIGCEVHSFDDCRVLLPFGDSVCLVELLCCMCLVAKYIEDGRSRKLSDVAKDILDSETAARSIPRFDEPRGESELGR